MKRKITLLSLIIFSFAKMQAQDYHIRFAGSGTTTTVETVEVQNLTQGTLLTLNGSDTLHLFATVGIERLTGKGDKSLRIYPNPVTNTGTIEFEIPKPGLVTINLYDIAGKKVISTQNNLQAGIQTFKVSDLNSGIYTVSIKSDNFLYSGKIISTGNAHSAANMDYVNTIPKINTSKSLKSAQSIFQMQYNPGERILIKAISGIYATISTFVPTGDTTITSNFVDATDGEGNHYATVTIGTQVWMAENLKTTKYNDGTSISLKTGASAWWGATGGAYCWYDNNYAINGSVYGALYNWKAVDSLSNGGKNIAPKGWHVPTHDELTTFTNYLGGDSIAGRALKETGTTHWNSPNIGATNASGFSALGGGGRWGTTSVFYDMGVICDFWTVTPVSGVPNAWECEMNTDGNWCFQTITDQRIGLSVRCLKD